MNSIKELRSGLGISQMIFANMLGVSRSVVAMAETGVRPLPTNALIKFGQLQVTSLRDPLPELDQQTSKWLDEAWEENRHSVTRQLARCEQMLSGAIQKLEAMRISHQRTSESLKLISAERFLFEGVPTYLEQLEKAYYSAMEEFRKTHPAKQRTVQLRIAELHAIISLYRQELEMDQNLSEVS